MLKHEVTKRLNKSLKELCYKTHNDELDLKRRKVYNFLKDHERWEGFVNNVCAQVKTAEHKLGSKFTNTGLNLLCKEAVKLFANAAITHKEQQLMTQGEKTRLQVEASKRKTAEEILKEGHLVPVDPSTRNPKDKKAPKYEPKIILT